MCRLCCRAILVDWAHLFRSKVQLSSIGVWPCSLSPVCSLIAVQAASEPLRSCIMIWPHPSICLHFNFILSQAPSPLCIVRWTFLWFTPFAKYIRLFPFTPLCPLIHFGTLGLSWPYKLLVIWLVANKNLFIFTYKRLIPKKSPSRSNWKSCFIDLYITFS